MPRTLCTVRQSLFLTAVLCLVSIDSHAFAGDATVSPRPHSLIHRQTVEVAPLETEAAAPPRPPVSAPAKRSAQRKLTKRPAQLPTAGGSNDMAASGATASSRQPVSPVPIPQTATESRIPMAATGLAPLRTLPTSTAVTTTAGTSNATSSAATSQASAKPSVAAAVPGIGPGTTVSPGVATGRGLQRLTTEMPGLTQLMAPTVAVSSAPPQPPPSSLPSATQPAPAPPPPPGTGTATLSWTLNSETDLAGYKVYVGTASGLYNYPGSPFAVGVTSSYTITGLPSGQTYYFAISAYDSSGSESGLSSEVSKSIY